MYEIYAYWNNQELATLFNGVVAIMGSGDFLGLTKTVALITIISVSLGVLVGKGSLIDMWKWVFMVALIHGIFMIPKTSVAIVDRTGYQSPVIVANVPVGLAFFASTVTKIGDWLTVTYETVFSLPDDLRFRGNGTLFGHRLLAEKLNANMSTRLSTNMMEFYRECIVPELLPGGYIDFDNDLICTSDIWGKIKDKTNPARLVTISDNSGALSTLGCNTAYAQLTTQLSADATQKQSFIGRMIYPKLTTAQSDAAVTGAIASTTGYLLNSTGSALQNVQQAMVSNYIIDAQYVVAAQLGDHATTTANLAQAQAIRSTSDSYRLMAKISEGTLPKVKNVIEMIQYAIFPVVFLMLIAAGPMSGSVIKAYVQSLLWVQLWPPLYAVLNYVMTVYSAGQYRGASSTCGAMSLQTYSFLANATISDQAIAGMMAISIPAIAAAIVKGGEVGMQAIASVAGPDREAQKLGSAAALGNLQMGNRSIDNVSAFQENAAPTIKYGHASQTDSSGITRHYTTNNGKVSPAGMDAGMHQVTNFGVDVASKMDAGAAIKRGQEKSAQATTQHATEVTQGWNSTLQKLTDYTKSQGTHSGNEHNQTLQTARETQKAMSEADDLVKRATHELGFTADQSTAFAASLKGGMGIKTALAKFGVDFSATGSNSAARSQAYKDLEAAEQKISFARSNLEKISGSESDSFRSGDEASKRLSEGIKATTDKTRSGSEKLVASLTEAQSWKFAAERDKKQGTSFTEKELHEFIGFVQSQFNGPGLNGKPYSTREIEEMLADPRRMDSNERELMRDAASKFSEKRANEFFEAARKQVAAESSNPEAKSSYNENKPDPRKFVGAGEHEIVRNNGREGGITPGTGKENKVQGALVTHNERVDVKLKKGEPEVTAKASDIRGEVHDGVRQNTVLVAGKNTFITNVVEPLRGGSRLLRQLAPYTAVPIENDIREAAGNARWLSYATQFAASQQGVGKLVEKTNDLIFGSSTVAPPTNFTSGGVDGTPIPTHLPAQTQPTVQPQTTSTTQNPGPVASAGGVGNVGPDANGMSLESIMNPSGQQKGNSVFSQGRQLPVNQTQPVSTTRKEKDAESPPVNG